MDILVRKKSSSLRAVEEYSYECERGVSVSRIGLKILAGKCIFVGWYHSGRPKLEERKVLMV